MIIEREITQDLELVGGDKGKLIAKYMYGMNTIRIMHGGQISDIPVDKDNEYYILKQKLEILHKLTI